MLLLLLHHSPVHFPSSKTLLLPPTHLHLLPTWEPRRLHHHHHPPPLFCILDVQSSAPLRDFSDLSIVCDTIYYTRYTTLTPLSQHPHGHLPDSIPSLALLPVTTDFVFFVFIYSPLCSISFFHLLNMSVTSSYLFQDCQGI